MTQSISNISPLQFTSLPINEFPNEILIEILNRLPRIDALQAKSVNKLWYKNITNISKFNSEFYLEALSESCHPLWCLSVDLSGMIYKPISIKSFHFNKRSFCFSADDGFHYCALKKPKKSFFIPNEVFFRYINENLYIAGSNLSVYNTLNDKKEQIAASINHKRMDFSERNRISWKSQEGNSGFLEIIDPSKKDHERHKIFLPVDLLDYQCFFIHNRVIFF